MEDLKDCLFEGDLGVNQISNQLTQSNESGSDLNAFFAHGLQANQQAHAPSCSPLRRILFPAPPEGRGQAGHAEKEDS